MKSIASGVATNLASGLAMAGVASALKFIPGIGSIGGAVLMSASMYGLTLTSGYIYLKALCAAFMWLMFPHIKICISEMYLSFIFFLSTHPKFLSFF